MAGTSRAMPENYLRLELVEPLMRISTKSLAKVVTSKGSEDLFSTDAVNLPLQFFKREKLPTCVRLDRFAE